MADFQREFQKLMKFDHLEKSVQVHLKKVYSCLSISLIAAAIGAYVHLYTAFLQAGFLTLFGSLGLLFWLHMTPHTRDNETKRLSILGGFAFLSGIGLGPIMDAVIMLDPTIIPTAFLSTSVIFLCFTLGVLLSNDRRWLYLGGVLFSGLSCLMLLSLANIFFGSQLLYDINLYLGLAIVCGFILYDTQLIVEKKRNGDDDYIWHCVDLFMDFINLFRRIMILLANKEKKDKRNRD